MKRGKGFQKSLNFDNFGVHGILWNAESDFLKNENDKGIRAFCESVLGNFEGPSLDSGILFGKNGNSVSRPWAFLIY